MNFIAECKAAYGCGEENWYAEGGYGTCFAFDIATALYWRACLMKDREVSDQLAWRLKNGVNFKPGIDVDLHPHKIAKLQRKYREGKYDGEYAQSLELLARKIRNKKEIAEWYFMLLEYLDEKERHDGKKLRVEEYDFDEDRMGGIVLSCMNGDKGETRYLQPGDDAASFLAEYENTERLYDDKKALFDSPFRGDLGELLSILIHPYFEE